MKARSPIVFLLCTGAALLLRDWSWVPLDDLARPGRQPLAVFATREAARRARRSYGPSAQSMQIVSIPWPAAMERRRSPRTEVRHVPRV